MSYYILAYAFSIVFSIFGGISVFQKYKNASGFFFLLFTIFASLWFLFYFLFFAGIDNILLLLGFSRLAFGTGVLCFYSLFFFIYFFDSKQDKIVTPKVSSIIVLYSFLILLYFFTDTIVRGLNFIPEENIYREVPGGLFPLHMGLHLLCLFLIVFSSIRQLKKQTYLNRIRLKNILISAFLFAASLVILQLILPTFGIWIFEKEIVFLFALLVLSVVFTVKRYYFSSIGYGIGKVVVAIASIALSILLLNVFKYLFLHLGDNTMSYWSLNSDFAIVDTTLSIFFFVSIHRALYGMFLGDTFKLELKKKIQKLEQAIAHLTNLEDLNAYLKGEIKKIFKTSVCSIQIFDSSREKGELQRYFESDIHDYIFINDVVFIEENKSKFNKEKLIQEIPSNAFLILPLFNRERENVGIFILGVKSFGDFYNVDEIDSLKEFIVFLESHLKYIKTYEQLEDLSINLDKKVDDKTMEYNNLINKQKEFISVISHEIKSPIAAAIFQADSIIDDFESGTASTKEIQSELALLNNQLVKTSDLLSKLFSVQYFDTHAVTLFKEKVQVSHLLETELEVYSRMNPNIKFVNNIHKRMGFVDLDKIQFQQVIVNILNNAVKFLNKEDSTILLGANKKNGVLTVTIEDNGKGFQGIDISRLFDRYSTGVGASVGLGMGLYLCKRIIDMHGGEIIASTGELGGAKFIIHIPV